MSIEESDAASCGIKAMRGDAHRYNQQKLGDLPTHEKTIPDCKKYDWDRYNDTSMPAMMHMLRAGVGRPWNKVYSEIVAKIKKDFNSTLWSEIIGRLEHYVEIKPMHLGDGVYCQENGRPFYGWKARDNFFVHPETGLLLRPKKEWTELRTVSPRNDNRLYRYDEDEVCYVGGYHCYRKIEGIWYEVELVNVPSTPRNFKRENPLRPWVRETEWLWQQNLRDVVLKERLNDGLMEYLGKCHGYRTLQGKIGTKDAYTERWKEYNRSRQQMGTAGYMSLIHFSYPTNLMKYVYAKSLRQLSKAEIKRLGLKDAGLKVPDIVRKKKKRN